MGDIAHKRVKMRRFFGKHKDVFTSRRDGKSWPRWMNTFQVGWAYYAGLLRPGRHKNMENISVRMGLNADQVERFIRDSPWDHQILQEHLATNVPECIESPKGAIIIDDVGFEKQGKHSVCVQRQYSGALGKVGNCQVGVNVVYTSPGKKRNADQKTWPLGMRIYLPKEWVNDKARRAEVGVPESVTFKTKPEIALAIIDTVREHNVKHMAIVGDAGYGNDSDLRRELRIRKEPYVLGVTPSAIRVIDATVQLIPSGVGPTGGRRRKHITYPDDTLARSPSAIAKGVKEWTTVEWAEGTKGVLSGEFYRVKVRVTEGSVKLRHATDEVAWLLLEKAPDKLKAYLCWGMDNTPLEDLVFIAHLRWPIEQFHKEAKQILGIDRFEGRSWDGWHHHISMALLAYAFLSLIRAEKTLAEPLPSLRTVARALTLESATQELMQEHGLKRPKATAIATSMLDGYSDW